MTLKTRYQYIISAFALALLVAITRNVLLVHRYTGALQLDDDATSLVRSYAYDYKYRHEYGGGDKRTDANTNTGVSRDDAIDIDIDTPAPAPANVTIPEKYLLYYNHAGFSNQLLALQEATRIAMRTGRTLVLPPLLPHCQSRNNRGKYKHWDCEAANPKYIDDIEEVKFHAKLAADPNVPFPSWTEILDFEKVVDRDSGGQQLIQCPFIDMSDFMRKRGVGGVSISDFYSGNAAQMEGLSDYNNFVSALDQPHFAKQDVVVIGSAFKLRRKRNRDHLPAAGPLIPVGAYETFPPSHKVVKVLKRIVHGVCIQDQADAIIDCDPILPTDYIGAHLRIDDADMIMKSIKCSSSHYKKAFDPLIKDIKKIISATNTTTVNESGSRSKERLEHNHLNTTTRAIYLGSSSFTVRDCFLEALKQIQTPAEEGKISIAFEVLMIQDIIDRDSVIKGLIDDIRLPPNDVLVVIDQIIISLAENIVMGKTLKIPSTFQNTIAARHKDRGAQLAMLVLASV